jgi:hypothetical protein
MNMEFNSVIIVQKCSFHKTWVHYIILLLFLNRFVHIVHIQKYPRKRSFGSVQLISLLLSCLFDNTFKCVIYAVKTNEEFRIAEEVLWVSVYANNIFLLLFWLKWIVCLLCFLLHSVHEMNTYRADCVCLSTYLISRTIWWILMKFLCLGYQ